MTEPSDQPYGSRADDFLALRQKTKFGFVLIFSVGFFAMLIGLVVIAQALSTSRLIVDKNLRRSSELATALDHSWKLRFQWVDSVLGQKFDQAKVRSLAKLHSETVRKALDAYEAIEQPEAEHHLITGLRSDFERYMVLRDRFIDLAASGSLKQALQYRSNTLAPVTSSLTMRIEQLIALQQNQAQLQLNKFEQTVSHVYWLTGFLFLLGISILVFVSNLIERAQETAQSELINCHEQLLSALHQALESSRSFREVYDHVPVGIAKIDSSWKFISVNPAFTKMLEYTEKELQDRRVTDITHPDDIQSTEQVAEGLFEKSKNIIQFEKRYLTKSGRLIWVRIASYSHSSSEQSERYALSVVEDITEQKLKGQEHSFILDSLRIGVWKWDIASNRLDWDKNMYYLYGVDPGDFNGAYEAWVNTLSEENRAATVDAMMAAVRGDKDFDSTFQVVHRSGKVQEIRSRAFVVRDTSGKALQMYGINIDRSHEALLEKEMQRERSKAFLHAKLASLGEMSAGIAHEINNPLAIIQGSTQLLEKISTDPDKLKAKIEVIKSSCERIAKIIRGLKKFSSSGDLSPYQLRSLSDIVAESMALLQGRAQRFGVRVSVEAALCRPIYCNEVDIQQVMFNLIHNGIDAARDSTDPWVKVTIVEEAQSIVLQVIDSGAGLSEKVKKRLFHPFITTKDIGEGTGLGLSIAKGIMDDHKASIRVVPDVPYTCFELRFAVPVSEERSDSDLAA